MEEITRSALSLSSETASVEFKRGFDTTSDQEWLEIIKDIIAIANTNGGVIIFGLDDYGNPTGDDTTSVLKLDPADITNKIYKYTQYQFSEFWITKCQKAGYELAAIIIGENQIPVVFEKPGTFDIGSGRQKTAFSSGTVFFRHGAKSEPGNCNDIRNIFEKRTENVRQELLKNVRKVVEAPLGSRIFTVIPSTVESALPVNLSDDPNAPIIGLYNPDDSHPYRMKELIHEINRKLSSEDNINQYDIICIRRVHNTDSNSRYHYWSRFGGHQYSRYFVNWIIDQFKEDKSFFKNTRARMKKLKESE